MPRCNQTRRFDSTLAVQAKPVLWGMQAYRVTFALRAKPALRVKSTFRATPRLQLALTTRSAPVMRAN